MYDKPLPPPPPTVKKWRIDRIILKNEDSWQQLTNDMGEAEVDGWTVETLEFHNIMYKHGTQMMSILIMSREEVA